MKNFLLIATAVLLIVVGLYASDTWSPWARCAGGDAADGIEYRFSVHKEPDGSATCFIRLRDVKRPKDNGTSVALLTTYADASNSESIVRNNTTINGNNGEGKRTPAQISVHNCVKVREVEVIRVTRSTGAHGTAIDVGTPSSEDKNSSILLQ